MNLKRNAATTALALALAFGVAGCGAGSAQSSQSTTSAQAAGSSAQAAVTVEPLAKASGGKLVLSSPTSETASVEVTLQQGESLVIIGTLNAGSASVETKQNGQMVSTDSLYDGSSYGSAQIDPGTYEVEFKFADASGTAYALAYNDSQIDISSMETDEIISKVLQAVE